MDKPTQDMIGLAVKYGPDMGNVPEEYPIPAAGIARARFVGYFELGKHEERVFDDHSTTPKVKDKVELVFELSGLNHPPRDLNGEKVPQRISARENFELRPDSQFMRLFRQMNHAGKARHIVQLLGEPFLVEIFHTRSADGERTYAGLRGYDGYNIKGTTVCDEAGSNRFTVDVAPAMTDLKVFLWEFADRDSWDSIFIPGGYPRAEECMDG